MAKQWDTPDNSNRANDCKVNIPVETSTDESDVFYTPACVHEQSIKLPFGPVEPFKNDHWFMSSLTRTLVALLLLAIATNLDLFVLAVIHDRVPARPPLPDLIFDLIPKVDSALDISEMIIITSTVFMFIMIVVHRYTWIVLRRLMLIMSILYLMRAMTMAVTQLPVANPQYYCSPKTNFTEFELWSYVKTIVSRVSYMSLGMGLSINGRHTYCGDYIFSGHTTIILLNYLMVNRYLFSSKSSLLWRILHTVYGMVVLGGVSCILISRGHYTIDVVIAVCLTCYTFHIYHAMLDTVGHKPVQSIWRTFWWYWLFDYFEHEIVTNTIVFRNRFRLPPRLFGFLRRLRKRRKLMPP